VGAPNALAGFRLRFDVLQRGMATVARTVAE